MAQLVVSGGMLMCSFGVAPSTINVQPINRVMASSMPAATVMDKIPMSNIMAFGMCNTLSNPQVAAATSAASGVLTPQPCVPVTTVPWSPGSPTVMIGNKPALNNSCQLMCMWGGIITISNAGQLTVNVP